MTSYPSFIELADQVTDKKQFNAILSRQQKFFQTNPYKIEKLYSEAAKKIYSQILNKYQVTQQFKIMENAWQQNQRRVFVWYMVLLVDLHFISLQKRNQIQWNSLTSIFFDKNPSFLEFQFANILKSKSKITWNQEEDKILLQAMNKQKPGKWNQVSKRIFYQSDGILFKSPKHCRERWFNHLDQTKNKGSWTLQEDYTIFKFINQNGKRWACIVKLLENSRTEHMIKNRYNSLISKLKKNKKRREEEITQMVFRSLETEVKNERRERKIRNMEKTCFEKKPQILQFENGLQNSVSKPYISDEEKSLNSTDKILSIKAEPEIQIQSEEKIQVQKNLQEKQLQQQQERPLLNLYNQYADQYMSLNPYQFFYYYQQSPYMSLNPMMYG